MRLKSRRARIPIRTEREGRPLRIVADAAIASRTIGDGRLIPLVILDTSERPDVEELIRLHRHLSPGDTECQWGESEESDQKIVLILSFKRPAEVVAILEFYVVRHGLLIEQILTARAIYLQSSRDGDRFIKAPNAPKVLIEVPDTGFGIFWDDMFRRHIMKDMRRSGLSRQQAKRAASQFIDKWRKFGQICMKR